MLSKFARSVVLSRTLPSSSSSFILRPFSSFSSSAISSSSASCCIFASSSFSSSLLSRSFSTRPKSVEREVAKVSGGDSEELLNPASLKDVKVELSRVLDEDASDLAVVPDEDISEYIQEQELRITLEKESLIKVTKKLENYRISVEFQNQFDADAEEKGRLHEEAVAKHRAETGEAEPEEEEYKAPQHSFTVQIRTEKTSATSMPAFIELSCYADPGGALAVESFNFDDPELNPAGANPTTPLDASQLFRDGDDASKLYFDDLNEASQDKTLEWLEAMGIDDTFAVFVQQYSQMVRAQKLVEKMKNLKAFLAQ